MAKFPFYNQLDAMDCGPTCLRMVAKFYGKTFSVQSLRAKSSITREGVSLLGISDAADSIGLKNVGIRLSYEKLYKEVHQLYFNSHIKHNITIYEVHPLFRTLKQLHGQYKKTEQSITLEEVKNNLKPTQTLKKKFYIPTKNEIQNKSFMIRIKNKPKITKEQLIECKKNLKKN